MDHARGHLFKTLYFLKHKHVAFTQQPKDISIRIFQCNFIAILVKKLSDR